MAYNIDHIKSLQQKIEESNIIYLMAHVNPDGDALGSILALGNLIRVKMNKDIKMVIKSELPSSFKFMPNSELIEKDIKENNNIDLLITLDCASLDRLGLQQDELNRFAYIINIDHHVTNTDFGHINIVDEKASSTGEIIFNLINDLNYEISTEIAKCLYVSISTDTGSFKYTNTTSKTHLIASQLLEKNIDLKTINRKLYQSRSLEKTQLLVKGLNNLKLLNNNKVGIVCVDQNLLDSCKAEIEDVDIIVNFIRDIDTVEIACVIKEIEKEIVRVSLRSKGNIDISKVALKFNGGGHAKAAGCTINENIQKAEEKVTEEIKKLFG